MLESVAVPYGPAPEGIGPGNRTLNHSVGRLTGTGCNQPGMVGLAVENTGTPGLVALSGKVTALGSQKKPTEGTHCPDIAERNFGVMVRCPLPGTVAELPCYFRWIVRS